MGEVKLPHSVVERFLDRQHQDHRESNRRVFQMIDNQRDFTRELLATQNKHNEAQLALLGEYLKECARLFELALNPPLPTQPPDNFDETQFAQPRMSEEEEDLRYSLQLGDISQVEFDQQLKMHLDGAYQE